MANQFMKRLYDAKTFRRFVTEVISSLGDLRKAKKNPEIGEAFAHRVLLVVTGVNGCRICSHYHSRRALEDGMSEAEIASLLSNGGEDIPADEAAALAFAEHYAESAGHPSEEATVRFFEIYGEEIGWQLLALMRMIMVGNLHGNMIDALKHRIAGKAVEGSSFGQEISIVVLGPLFALGLLASKFLIGKPARRSVEPYK